MGAALGADDAAPDDIAPDDIAPDDIAPDDIAPEDMAPELIALELIGAIDEAAAAAVEVADELPALEGEAVLLEPHALSTRALAATTASSVARVVRI